MSFIRCLSNPEGLYIYADCRGRLNISWCSVDPPLSSRHRGEMRIPRHVFYKVVKQWDQRGDHAYFRGFSVEEQFIYTATGDPVHGTENLKRYLKDKRKREFKIKLSYKNDFVFLWYVTWEYVVRNLIDRP